MWLPDTYSYVQLVTPLNVLPLVDLQAHGKSEVTGHKLYRHHGAQL